MDTRPLAIQAEERDAGSAATVTLPAITLRSALLWTSTTRRAPPAAPREGSGTFTDAGTPLDPARHGDDRSIRSRHPSR